MRSGHVIGDRGLVQGQGGSFMSTRMTHTWLYKAVLVYSCARDPTCPKMDLTNFRKWTLTGLEDIFAQNCLRKNHSMCNLWRCGISSDTLPSNADTHWRNHTSLHVEAAWNGIAPHAIAIAAATAVHGNRQTASVSVTYIHRHCLSSLTHSFLQPQRGYWSICVFSVSLLNLS